MITINDIINVGNDNSKIEEYLNDIIGIIHRNGLEDQHILEIISLISIFHKEIFEKYKNKILYISGLFYKKLEEPKTLIEYFYKLEAESIYENYNENMTPVQANIQESIKNNNIFSFSAPTSAGKSFIFRKIIKEATNDRIIVVPSRALINEYMINLRNLFKNDNSILILQFVENINIKHTKRRIFVLTPERCDGLFKFKDDLKIEYFLFDEAQISDDKSRGVKFDSIVRRILKNFYTAKKIFAHPFINNPEAQITKHKFNISDNILKYSKQYTQNTTAKIYISKNKDKFFYFSPFEINTKEIEVKQDFITDKKILIYTTKDSLTKGKLHKFKEYYKIFKPKKIKDEKVLDIISEIEKFLGVDKQNKIKSSFFIKLMYRGIVIHHGSIPLNIRFLIEKFVNAGFAKFCFATSTLLQGINMPFDLVYINNFKFRNVEEEILNFKNLVGRAGRSSIENNDIDIGYVMIDRKNIKKFNNLIKSTVSIKETSLLEENDNSKDEYTYDIIEAIKNDTFNEELEITNEQVERIKKQELDSDIRYLLDCIINGDNIITGSEYRKLKNKLKDSIKVNLQKIYRAHLKNNRELGQGEKTIFSTAINILLWQIEGKSFAEIIGLRTAYITNKDERLVLEKKRKNKEITFDQYRKEYNAITLKYSSKYRNFPDKTLLNKIESLFNTSLTIKNFNYDELIYDTYEYMDRIISQKLSIPICAALSLYLEKTEDNRAGTLINAIRYGTTDETEIWLVKYGFSFEEIKEIKEFVFSIDENEIVFKKEIERENNNIKEIIKRYNYQENKNI